MDQDIAKILSQEEPGEFHSSLLSRFNALLESSRMDMAKYYEEWDRQDDIYRGIRMIDKQDEKAQERKEPTKMVVPITHSQVQTFVAFNFAIFFQREYFFELTPFSAESSKGAETGSALLQRDLDHNNFQTKAYQFFLDVGRFGLGIMKDFWNEERQWVKQVTPAQPASQFLGVSVPFTAKKEKSQWQELVKYQGNKIMSVSPYRFFPDTRLPLDRFQDGEFCASEDEYSYLDLKKLEAQGAVAGCEYIPQFSKEKLLDGRKTARLRGVNTDGGNTYFKQDTKGAVLITEVEVRMIPAEVEVGPNKTLGPEKHEVKYLVWIANDQRIIRLEPMNYAHDEFTYSVAQLSPDMHHLVNDGISGTIEAIQDVLSWFVNSHITSVRKVIQNQILVDPQGVNMDDVKQRRSVIRLKEGASRLGAERWIHQLAVQDVTGNHMQDAEQLQKLVQIVTGIGDNALGQFHQGRRSATEAKNVNAGTASRLKMIAVLLNKNGFEPLGKRMLSNLREGLTLSTYVRLFGLTKDPTLQSYIEFAKVDKRDLVGDYDFEVFDATLPSERQYQAQAMEETMALIFQYPEIAALLGFDLRAMFVETMELRGIRHPERFRLGEAELAARMQQMAMQQAAMGQANAGNQPTAQSGQQNVPQQQSAGAAY